MSWIVEIFHQERGTKNETKTSLRFASRDTAIAALQKFESEVKAAGADDFIVIDSGSSRASLLKQDFRRTNLYEYQPRTVAIRSSN